MFIKKTSVQVEMDNLEDKAHIRNHVSLFHDFLCSICVIHFKKLLIHKWHIIYIRQIYCKPYSEYQVLCKQLYRSYE